MENAPPSAVRGLPALSACFPDPRACRPTWNALEGFSGTGNGIVAANSTADQFPSVRAGTGQFSLFVGTFKFGEGTFASRDCERLNTDLLWNAGPDIEVRFFLPPSLALYARIQTFRANLDPQGCLMPLYHFPEALQEKHRVLSKAAEESCQER